MTTSGGRGAAVVIEDDEDIRFLLEATLQQAGFAVTAIATGTEGVAAVRELDPVITTLDISLPDIDGFEVARRIRAFSMTYLLMITAHDDEIDTLFGLESGADDYVTKPFRPREVRSRIEAMLRRPRITTAVTSEAAGVDPAASSPSTTGSSDEPVPQPSRPATDHAAAEVLAADLRAASLTPGAAAAEDDGVLVCQGMKVDVDARLVAVDGRDVDLTRSEFDILAAFLESPRRVLTKDELTRRLWSHQGDPHLMATDADRRAVEVHIANLRRKLDDDATRPRFIQTVRGVGYRLVSLASRSDGRPR